MLAILCPGQGSQSPGFLTPWLDLPGVREHLEALSEAAGVDLVLHGTVSDEETIRDTAVAQPLIVAAGLVAARVLLGDTPLTSSTVVAGHSVGELTASAVAGALTEQDAIRLVRTRAQSMAAAAAVTPTGMSAVLGGDPDDVAATLERHGLTAANANGGGQIVAAGTVDQLAALAADPPQKARVIPLKVAGAFHTHHMAPAVEALEELRPSLSPAEPLATLLSNFDGEPVASGDLNLDSLIAQVSRPVRWDLCMQRLQDMGVSGVLELPPAGTLTGLAKRGMRGTAGLAVKTPEDLSAARAFMDEHSRTAPPADAPIAEGNA
ncbi:[acyl-carrier-protein] S-malonyltransferase [Arthrobacter subterraneus]|uniref:[acyl-carrier-protein] S-malonyltransferase n=1 Tax=Arthrobacter subterraneus TaxID=335973 RepID=A0A1G8FBZ0_9MICC|nr:MULTISPECIES: ACP S-malonyltransferase [Arthrobacter]SDH79656.1 [acyl-carrier-protein] S-malonyltransferase [Arthrobacter subterraneus]